MTKYAFVGDVHGNFPALARALDQHPEHHLVQVGDLGLGIPGALGTFTGHPRLSFVRGNHDAPAVAARTPGYLGEFGYHETLGLFYVSGAYSVNWRRLAQRGEWWPDEELSAVQRHNCLNLYARVRPVVVVSHDCPVDVLREQRRRSPVRYAWEDFYHPNRTASLLQALWEVAPPKLWVYGHHHHYHDFTLGSTRFICLPELLVLPAEELLPA